MSRNKNAPLTAEQIKKNDQRAKTTEVLHLRDEATCWEHKTGEIIRDNQSLIEIPAFTRVMMELPKLCFQSRECFPNVASKSKREIVVAKLPGTDISTLDYALIPCYTPLTRQQVGCALIKRDQPIHQMLSSNRYTDEPNCCLVVNYLDDWQMHVYTIRHVKKGGVLVLDHNCNDEKETPSPLSAKETLCIQPWFPPNCYYLAPLFYPLLASSGNELCLDTTAKSHKISTIRENDSIKATWIKPKTLAKRVNNWREFVLFYCLRMLMNPESDLDYMVVENAIAEAYSGQSSSCLLLTALSVEGFFNSNLNVAWYQVFTLKLLMGVSQKKGIKFGARAATS
jgi:hypothetical protein